jgi:hypothetical protein
VSPVVDYTYSTRDTRVSLSYIPASLVPFDAFSCPKQSFPPYDISCAVQITSSIPRCTTIVPPRTSDNVFWASSAIRSSFQLPGPLNKVFSKSSQRFLGPDDCLGGCSSLTSAGYSLFFSQYLHAVQKHTRHFSIEVLSRRRTMRRCLSRHNCGQIRMLRGSTRRYVYLFSHRSTCSKRCRTWRIVYLCDRESGRLELYVRSLD